MVILLVAVLAAPFTDTQSRFALDLPRGWTYAPMPGDLEGATFKKTEDGLMAYANVRVWSVGPEVTLASLLRDTGAVTARASGYRLVVEEPATVGGQDGVRRRYVSLINDDKRFAKMSEDRFLVVADVAFLVHVETLAEAFGSFERDFEAIFASLRPGGAPSPSADGLISSPILGRWAMVGDPATIFDLRADGTFVLAGTRGVFGLEGARLRARPHGGGEEVFDWELVDGELVLRGAALGEPIRYRRAAKTEKK